MAEQIVYNKIGKGYNTTRKADPYITDRLYNLLEPAKNGTYLDIGCGTGNYTVKLAKRGLQLIGVDPSEIMLSEAMAKNSSVKWVAGYAENIPLNDQSVDGAIATLTIHHWADPEKAFQELARVLKPNATMVVFTFTPGQEEGYWFNHFFPQMMKKGMQKSMPFKRIEETARAAGLAIVQTEKYFVHEGLEDLFGYSGKHDPERYFDPAIIKGISYFSLYATEEEVQNGLQLLRQSIDTGEFDNIKRRYENDLGDYLFIVLRKTTS